MTDRPLNLVFKALLVGAALVAFSATAQAQPRIGTVDLKKVFDGYYKTRQADTQLKDRATEAEKVLKGMLDDYQKSTEDYKRLSDGAVDQAVSSEERDRRSKAAQTKLLELQEIERSVKQYRAETTSRLEEQKKRMRDNILREIRDVITTKAKAGNYAFVLDIAAETVNLTPVVLYTTGQNDLTDEILAQINANAPAGVLGSVEPPAAAPPVAAPARATPGAATPARATDRR
jgi:outer membrane protein